MDLILMAHEHSGILESLLDKSLKELEAHFLNHIDEAIKNKENLYAILGCLSLYSQVCGTPMSANGYSNLVYELTQTYGNCYAIINRMEKLGLLSKKVFHFDKNQISFPQLAKRLKLFSAVDIDDVNQNSLYHLYGGYAPLSAKLIEREIKVNETTLICFVGGCNYSEIGACRCVCGNRNGNGNGNVMVLTTDIFNQARFFQSV